ncbi:MAG: CAP domain-containing protein, partial [Spirochaetia bacterium]|nr:CAP domain-containing protein [Spirochaetia bacterium]
ELARTGCRMEHRPRSGKFAQKYGENLFMGTVGYYTVKDAVKSWESEKKDYHGGPIKNDRNFYKIGHYTQLIWKQTTHVGCGQVECKRNLIVVCNYNPAGNMVGRTPFD